MIGGKNIWELQEGKLAQDVHKSDGGESQSLVLEPGNGKGLEALASLYESFEQSHRDLCEIDKKFDVEFEEMEDLMEKALEAQKLADVAVSAVSHTRCTFRGVATTFDGAGIELNEVTCCFEDNSSQLVWRVLRVR